MAAKADIFGTVVKKYQEEWKNGEGHTTYLIVDCGFKDKENKVQIKLLGENAEMNFDNGAKIHLKAWIDGREWNGKYFMNLTFAEIAEFKRPEATEIEDTVEEIDSDDIPF